MRLLAIIVLTLGPLAAGTPVSGPKQEVKSAEVVLKIENNTGPGTAKYSAIHSYESGIIYGTEDAILSSYTGRELLYVPDGLPLPEIILGEICTVLHADLGFCSTDEQIRHMRFRWDTPDLGYPDALWLLHLRKRLKKKCLVLFEGPNTRRDVQLAECLGLRLALIFLSPDIDSVERRKCRKYIWDGMRIALVYLLHKQLDPSMFLGPGKGVTEVRGSRITFSLRERTGRGGVTSFFGVLTVVSFILVFVLSIYMQFVQTRRVPVRVKGVPQKTLNRLKRAGYAELAGTIDMQTCVICLEKFTEGSSCRVLPCNHIFHPECIDPWLLYRSARCPYCQVAILS